MNRGSDPISKNINVVPQVFYDIIARLIPGIMVLTISLFINYGSDRVFGLIGNLVGKREDLFHVSFSLIGLTLVASYTISIVLMGIWSLFLRLFKIGKWNTVFLKTEQKKWKDINDNCRSNIGIRVDCMPARISEDEGTAFSLSFVYDYVRLHAPDVGSRLVKIRAEIHMCTVLLTGFMFLTVWNSINLFKMFSLESLIIETLLILSIFGLFYFMKDLEERFMTGLCNYWFIINRKLRMVDEKRPHSEEEVFGSLHE